MELQFNGVTLTCEAITEARQWFHDNALACIREMERGDVRVNNPAEYRVWREEQAKAALAGEIDHTLTFRQHAYYIQTGNSIAILPL